MSITHLLTHTVSVKRSASAGGVKHTYQPVAGLEAVPCLIQPLSPEDSATLADAYGSDFKGFFAAGTDIQIGDKLTDQDSRDFSVRGIRQRNYGPAAMQHLEVLLGADRSAD